MKIIIGSDHAGFELKEKVVKYLESTYEVTDLGCYSHESVDYPEIGNAVGRSVVENNCFGIVICGSGIGISIAANKVPLVRCALVSEPFSAALSREHNNANILALGGRLIGTEMAFKIIDTFLKTEFSNGENHLRRINKL